LFQPFFTPFPIFEAFSTIAFFILDRVLASVAYFSSRFACAFALAAAAAPLVAAIYKPFEITSLV